MGGSFLIPIEINQREKRTTVQYPPRYQKTNTKGKAKSNRGKTRERAPEKKRRVARPSPATGGKKGETDYTRHKRETNYDSNQKKNRSLEGKSRAKTSEAEEEIASCFAEGNPP